MHLHRSFGMIKILISALLLLPGFFLNAGVYNFSGTIVGYPDTTQVLSDAKLRFISPDGVEYDPVYTDMNGDWQTTIDTYVKQDNVDIGKEIAVSAPVLNPTADRSGFYVNIPYRIEVKVKMTNLKGEDIELENPMSGQMEKGVYYQGIDFSRLPEGMYLVTIMVGGVAKTHKFTHMHGASNYTGMHFAPHKTSSSWQPLGVKKQSSGDYWRVIIEHDDYYTREVLLNAQEGTNIYDLDLVNKSFDMNFFDECAGRNVNKGTERWAESPKLYIIDGPLDGLSGYETPSQEEINRVLDFWKNKIARDTGGKIAVPDSNIYIGHDINDPTLQSAVDTWYNGGVEPADGWNVVNWTWLISGSGSNNPYVTNGVITKARQFYKPGDATQAVVDLESIESSGLPEEPANLGRRHDGNDFKQEYRDNIRLVYSRPEETYSPDRATVPLN